MTRSDTSDPVWILTWRETVPEIYWKADCFRVEYMEGVYVALRLLYNERVDQDLVDVPLGRYQTLAEAKTACHEERHRVGY